MPWSQYMFHPDSFTRYTLIQEENYCTVWRKYFWCIYTCFFQFVVQRQFVSRHKVLNPYEKYFCLQNVNALLLENYILEHKHLEKNLSYFIFLNVLTKYLPHVWVSGVNLNQKKLLYLFCFYQFPMVTTIWIMSTQNGKFRASRMEFN